MYSDILCAILFDMFSDNLFVILSGILFGIFSDILIFAPGNLSDINSHILFGIQSGSNLAGIYSDMLSDILSGMWHVFRSACAQIDLELALGFGSMRRLRSSQEGSGPRMSRLLGRVYSIFRVEPTVTTNSGGREEGRKEGKRSCTFVKN